MSYFTTSRRLLSLWLLAWLFDHGYSYTISDANNLHTALFTGYNKLVLPEYPVTIQAEYNLLTINSLDVKTQTLATTGWFTVIVTEISRRIYVFNHVFGTLDRKHVAIRCSHGGGSNYFNYKCYHSVILLGLIDADYKFMLVWNDSRLAWTKSSYGDIEHIFASQELLWHPELIVENSVVNLSNLGEDDTMLRIQFDGEVRWEPPALLATSCDMDVTFFPYDFQTCDIELASWGFHSDAVNLTFYKSHINLVDYRTNGEWDLITTSQFTSQIIEDDLAYSELLFRIVVERLPGHYIMSIIFPVIVTAILSSVTFILPVESGEKVGYILTVLLSLAVLLTLFADNMPTTSKHTSVLVVFLTLTLGLSSVIIVITVLIIRLHHKPPQYYAPDWVYTFVNQCKKITCKERIAGQTSITTLQKKEGSRSGERKAWPANKQSVNSRWLSNQELAAFFDNFFFITFSTLYVIVVISFTVTLSVSV